VLLEKLGVLDLQVRLAVLVLLVKLELQVPLEILVILEK